tara:strand:+ start:6310 stop:6537 length:228 start_codon:yes stop_codon:yes gene_type:complete
MKYISFPVFLISLAIGLLYTYLSNPDMHVIYIYPTPEMQENVQFKDAAEMCYSFKAKQVKCPRNENDITVVPAQV